MDTQYITVHSTMYSVHCTIITYVFTTMYNSYNSN